MYMTSVAAAYVLIPDMFVASFAALADPEGSAEIYRLTVILLRLVAVYSIFDTMNIVFTSAIKGAGDTRFVMFMVVTISTLVLAIPTYPAIVILEYGLMVSWILVTAYVITLDFAFFLRFLGGKWKSMRVIEKSVAALSSKCSEWPDAKFKP